MPNNDFVKIKIKRFRNYYKYLSIEQRKQTAVIFHRHSFTWEDLNKQFSNDKLSDFMIKILKIVNLERTRLIDTLDQKSLEILSKFGEIKTDDKTGRRHIKPYKKSYVCN